MSEGASVLVDRSVVDRADAAPSFSGRGRGRSRGAPRASAPLNWQQRQLVGQAFESTREEHPEPTQANGHNHVYPGIGRGRRKGRGDRQYRIRSPFRAAEGTGDRGSPTDTEGGIQQAAIDTSSQQPFPARQQHMEQQLQKTSAAQDTDYEAPSCVVCCDSLQEVAVGKCNHKSVCARCCLRLRLCYKDNKCPLCKTLLEDVVVGRWRKQGVPDFAEYEARKGELWQKKGWAKGVFVDDWRPQHSRGPPLFVRLQQLTARACIACDPQGRKPFPSDKPLQQHLEMQHDMRLCHVCLSAHHLFHLEMQPLSRKELQDHLTAEHPKCEFCNMHFYSGDELYSHMQQRHFTCHVCQRTGKFFHFADAGALADHFRKAHFLCEEAECRDCFVAFETLPELQQHHLQRHSAHMPRWDQSRARRIELDFASSSVAARRQPQRPESRRQRTRQEGDSQPRPAQQAPQSQSASRPADTHAMQQSAGNFTLIDDDVGMAPAAFPDMPASSAAHAPLSDAWTHSSPVREAADAFPSLQSAAASNAPATTAPAGAQPVTQPPRPPRLVKRTVKCPCGRRVSHQVLREDEAAPLLRCDSECQRRSRTQQLADAFSVDDPDHHLSSFDRNRTPTYSPELLVLAQQNMEFVRRAERQLAAVVASPDWRHSFPAMPRHQRQILHELAGQYGMASQSKQNEPHRHVELFKSATSSIPNRLLSHAAATLSPDQLSAAARAAQGYQMQIVDISPNLDLEHFLRQWEGHFTVEYQSATTAVVRFRTAEALKQATNHIGGGVRGLFRVGLVQLEQKTATYNPNGHRTGSKPPVSSRPSAPAGAARASAAASANPPSVLRPPMAGGSFSRPTGSGMSTFGGADSAFGDDKAASAAPKPASASGAKTRTVASAPSLAVAALPTKSDGVDDWEEVSDLLQ